MNASAQVRVLKRAVAGLREARHAVCELDQNRDLLEVVNESLRMSEELLLQQIDEADVQEPGWQDVCFPSHLLVQRRQTVRRADVQSHVQPERVVDIHAEIV